MDREDAILEFIRQNPGCTNTEVIDYMDPPEGKKRAAPNTTIKILKYLIKDKKVICKVDKDGRTHHLYINDKNKFNMINQLLSKMHTMLEKMNKQKLEVIENKMAHPWITNYSPGFRQVCDDALHSLLINTEKIIPVESDCHKLYARIIEVLRELESTFYQPSSDFKYKQTVVDLDNGERLAFPLDRQSPITAESIIDIETVKNLIAIVEEFKPFLNK